MEKVLRGGRRVRVVVPTSTELGLVSGGLGNRFNQCHVLTLVTFVVVVVMAVVVDDDDEADTESAPGVLGS